MPEWLQDSVTTELHLTPAVIAARLAVATVAGLIVAAIGYFAHGWRKSDAPMLLTTLVLLTVLIAMVTLVIGNSVARAFGLVGALSIVRFRTVVDDTRDTAFVIFAVIIGMSIGAGAWMVPAIGLPLVGLLALSLGNQKLLPSSMSLTHLLTIKIGLGRNTDDLLAPLFDRYLATRTLRSVATARQGAAIELIYAVTLREPLDETQVTSFIADLNRIEGIQSAELSRL